MTDNAKTTAGDAEVGAITRTIEQLSAVAAKGPIIFTQVLGGLLLVLGVADKLTEPYQVVLKIPESPAELAALLASGAVLILGGLSARMYDQRIRTEAAVRIQSFAHKETMERTAQGALPGPVM
jgi:hypothetical protein